MMNILAQLAGSFVAPLLAGAGVLAVSIPLAIHLLSRLRRKRESWGAMRFLRLAYQKQRTKVRMEQWLLLLTRCVLMALIGLALAGPMLGGGWSRWLGGGGEGRLIVVVVDDSLSTQAIDESVGETWWQGVSGRATELIRSAGAGDRVAVWSLSRPARELSPPGRADAALGAIESHAPTDASADWAGMHEGVRALLEREASLDRRVIVLSPFARGDGALSEAGDRSQRWPADVSVHIAEPAGPLDNVQLASVDASRDVVLTSQTPGVGPDGELSLSVRVRRFGNASEAARLGLSTRLLSTADARVLGSAQREVALSPGQLETTAQLTVPLTDAAGPEVNGAWVVAQLTQPGDSLTADDALLGFVRLRSAVRVGLWDPMNQALTGMQDDGLSSEAFIRAALSPGGQGAVQLVELERGFDAGDASSPWAGVDAVVVFGADRLNEAMWSDAQAWVRQGGWLLLLPGSASAGGEQDAGWLARLARSWQLDWQTSEGRLNPTAEAVALSDQSPTPDPLQGLSSDWRALLGPVRVERWWGLRVPAAQSWLTLSNGEALLASAEFGTGRVLLFTSAADTEWTNLPAKPLFPALLQEIARAAAAGQPTPRWTAGDMPTLESAQPPTLRLLPALRPTGERVEDVPQSSVLEMTQARQVTPETANPLQVESVENGPLLRATSPVRRAAGFLPELQVTGLTVPLIVNADVQAGDTTTWPVGELAEAWDARAARWSWLPEQAGLALRTEASRVQLGRFFLWAVLALLVLETLMSRWFSHAESSAPSLRSRLHRWLDTLLHHPAPGR